MNLNYNRFRIEEGMKISLKDFSTCEDGGLTKKDATGEIEQNISQLKKYQELFYADD